MNTCFRSDQSDFLLYILCDNGLSLDEQVLDILPSIKTRCGLNLFGLYFVDDCHRALSNNTVHPTAKGISISFPDNEWTHCLRVQQHRRCGHLHIASPYSTYWVSHLNGVW